MASPSPSSSSPAATVAARATTTAIFNPGIAARVESDAAGYARYGFRVERRCAPDDVDADACYPSSPAPDGALSSGASGSGTRPSQQPPGRQKKNPPQDSSRPLVLLHRDDDAARPPGAKSTPAAAATLRVSVDDRKLASSVGPFLRTLARLCVDPVDPRSLRVVVAFDWDAVRGGGGGVVDGREKEGWDEKKTAVCADSNRNQAEKDPAKEEEARRAAHEVHMIVRNSMGAALFLDLAILLPVGVDPDRVTSFMDLNDDGCYAYPTITIYGRSSGSEAASDGVSPEAVAFHPHGLPRDKDSAVRGGRISTACLDGYDPSSHSLNLSVRTRMCTVRLTPVLYRLARVLRERAERGGGIVPPPVPIASPSAALSKLDLPDDDGDREAPPPSLPRLFVCVEKVSNLHRVLMLCRDYTLHRGDDEAESSSSAIGALSRLVVVTHDDERLRNQLVGASQRWVRDGKGGRGGGGAELRLCKPPPPIMTVEEASAELHRVRSVDSVIGGGETRRRGAVAQIDLHDEALTLGEEGLLARSESRSSQRGGGDGRSTADVALRTAAAVVWGFEAGGIPPSMVAADGDAFVQLRSRTSLNLVATLSIIMHVLWYPTGEAGPDC